MPFDPLQLSDVLDGTPYRLVGNLGRGGMGDVYEVEQTFLKRRFALKVLRPHLLGGARAVERMKREARVMGRLSHPNIVEVVDFWMSPNGQPCIVMELLSGRTLHRELQSRGSLPEDEAVLWACQALGALVVAHQAGVVHRDLKTDNLFLHEVAGYGRVLKILDFGIARLLPSPVDPRSLRGLLRTQTGAVVGTPLFMSPEAGRGERVDARSDIFSLGVVLYVLLAGQAPFDMLEEAAAPTPLAEHVSVSPVVEAAVLRAIRHEPSERFQTAKEFLDVLLPLVRPSRLPRPSP